MAIGKKKSLETTPRPGVARSVVIDTQLDIGAGFQRLLQHFKEPHVAVEQFNTGLRTNRVRLLADGAVVPVHFILTHLVMVAKQAADGRWTVDIDSTGRGFERPKMWSVPAAEIDTLIKGDAGQRGAGGRPRKYNREEILIEAANFLHKKGAIPAEYGVTDLQADLEMILEPCPERSLLIEIIGPLLNRLKS